MKLKDGNIGIVRFVGELKNESGVHYGIDLSEPYGNHDGSHNGIYYFTTQENYGLFVKKHHIVKVITKNEYNLPRYTVGDIVGVAQIGCNAIIRFIGWTLFHPEVIWYGLQLEEPIGDNDGTIDGRKYFTCAKNLGLFVMCNEIGPKINKNKSINNRKAPKSPKTQKKTKRKKKKARKKTMTKIPYEEFVAQYEGSPTFDQDFVQHYRERFYFQVTNPFFRAYSEIDKIYNGSIYKNKNEARDLPKEIIELVIKYCSTPLNTKSKDIMDHCDNIFSSKECYYKILYTHYAI